MEFIFDYKLFKNGPILVIGASDSGKTTFCNILFNHLKNRKNLSLIDLDLGQNQIGIPSTQTLLIENEKINFFVGSFSPLGNFLDYIVGAKKLYDLSIKNGYETSIIDTSGFVLEKYGAKSLLHSLFEILNPYIVIALEKENELENILSPYEKSKRFIIKRLKVSKEAKIKSKSFRKNIKIEKIKNLFINSEFNNIDIKNYGIIGKYPVVKNQLISFLDNRGFSKAFGIIKEIKNDILNLKVTNGWKESKMIKTSEIILDENYHYKFLKSI
ncbi:Clp1/GlmU family protein [Nitrosophilus kaiyonis]|uniref:Clp1/GlmU family protein n=1 Tax=Nitrosophilus kaiyonis TaxID=2930200 RepID=UPI002492F959|nr:Clp1/GlmU family protein [Nitrosophilus kaiyonis]